MPKPKGGEKLSDLMARFFSSKREAKSSDVKPRLALGYAEAKEHSKKEKQHG